MALQTGKLSMVGLGVLKDAPPNTIQPPLVDRSIHLRWTGERELGFPWYGFYLFRRPDQKGEPLCLSSLISELEPGPWPDNYLNTLAGRVTSDANLVLTDDFAPSGQVELDLNARRYLRFSLPPGEPVRRIEARIGFREKSAERVCVDFRSYRPDRSPNPRMEQGARFLVRNRGGNQPDETRIVAWGDTPGLDCRFELEITLPGPTPFVELTLANFAHPDPAVRVEAFNADGAVVTTARMRMGIPKGGSETLRLEGAAIARVVVHAPRNETLLHEICFKSARRVCADFKGRQPGQGPDPQKRLGPNPRIEQGARFLVRDRAGNLPNLTRVVMRGGALGLDFGFEVDITLPRLVSFVELTLTYSASGGTVAAFDADGTGVDSARIGTPQGTAQTLRLEGEAIERVVVRAPRGETILHEICFGTEAETEIHVTGLLESTPVTEAVVKGQPGQVVTVRLESDAISAVEFGAGPAALVDLCFVPVSQGATDGWEQLSDFPYPLCLPVTHPDYPCNGTPIDQVAAEALALGRIRYGPPVEPPAHWAGSPFQELHDQLLGLVEGGPASRPMADPARSAPPTPGVPDPPDPGVAPPTMPNQHPLDLVLLSTLHPALAQMVGLYWVDQTAKPNTAYDYLIVADHEGEGDLEATTVLSLLQRTGFRNVDGYIVFNKRVEPASPLPAPDGLRAYALPGSSMRAQGGGIQDATNNAGLRWNLSVTEEGELLPGRAILYHLWRADLGNGTAPAAASGSALVTKNGPVLVTEPRLDPLQTPQRPADWPPFAPHAIDRGLADGWYGYEVSGIDIFGRHSPNSAAGPWYQWTPTPEPRPWYYQDPPADSIVHPYAVRLLDKTPPPLPTGVEAYALDPADPTVLRDAAYNAWHATLSASERDTLVGLRVRWLWTEAHMRQAPDTREFRIYYHPGTNLPTPDHSVATQWQERYYVVGYDEHATVTTDGAGRPLRRYEVFLPAPKDAFRAGLPLAPSLADPIVYAHVGVSAADDKAHTADSPQWAAGRWGGRSGNEGRVGPPAKIFRVLRTSPSSPVPPPDAERVFATPADYHSRSFYTYRWRPAPHLQTHIFRALDDAVFRVDWLIRTTRTTLDPTNAQHEAIFPTTWTLDRKQAAASQLNAITSLASYAALSSDAQDILTRLPGNEGAPGSSGLQQRDWAIRTSRRSLGTNDTQYFPSGWDTPKRQTVATELNAVASFNAYRGLSNDGLRVLAGLPGNEPAFTQITIQPLDPQEPDLDAPSLLRWRDRVGLDTDPSYIPQPTLRAYEDTVDGRSTNRYFYRAAYVDGAHNRSELSLSGPPVYLPNVVPPRAPVITKILGGDRQITLKWASNREPDLAEYRVYRTENEESTRDLRLMTLVHTEAVPVGDPAARPAEVTWTDTPVPGLVTFYYMVMAVDEAGNASEPSPVFEARAFDESPPIPPVPSVTWVVVGNNQRAQISWTSTDETLLQRREAGSTFWVDLTQWQISGTHSIIDDSTDPARAYSYRARARKTTGAVAIGTTVTLTPAL